MRHERIKAASGLGAGTATQMPLLLAAIAALLLLALPVTMPIGAMYWDNYIYIDGGWRILSGQIPSVDFFAPAGPLEYWLTALLMAVFPQGQTALLANWGSLVISLPLMGFIGWHAAKKAPSMAIALTTVFALYAFLPFNTSEYYPFPGIDAFGIYNRHAAQLLYCLVAALLFVRDRKALAVAIAVSMIALFLTKITGFLAGGLICLFALLVGRVTIGIAIASAAAFLAVLLPLELLTGVVRAYVANIAELVAMNDGGLAGRLVQAMSRTFGICLPAGLLALTLLYAGREKLAAKLAAGTMGERLKAFDQPAFWLGTVTLAGILFESQNTGSQEMMFLWPVMLVVLGGLMQYMTKLKLLGVIAILAVAVVVPPLVATIQHASRAIIGGAFDQRADAADLGSLARVSVPDEPKRRATEMRAFYQRHPEVLAGFADDGILPSVLLYSDFDFQALWLRTASEAVATLRGLEKDGLDYETVMTLDFANPFPFVLGKQAPLHVAIGADPFRAVPKLDSETMASVSAADIVLQPRCPYTTATLELHSIYAEALTGHRKVSLTPCYDILVRPGIRMPGE